MIKHQIDAGIHNVFERKTVIHKPALQVFIAPKINLDLSVVFQLIPASFGLAIDCHAAFIFGKQLDGKSVRPHILDLDTASRKGSVGSNIYAIGRIVRITVTPKKADQQEHKRRNTNGDEQKRQEGHLSLLRLAAAGNIVRRARRLRAAGAGRGGVIGIGIAWYFRRV